MKNLVKIFIIAFLSIIVFEASAQHGGFKFGLSMANANLKGGDVTSPTIDNKLLIAPKVGFIFDTPLYEGLFLQTGIFTAVSGFRYDDTRDVEDNNGLIAVDSKEMLFLLYLEFPLDFGYRHQLNDNLQVMVMAGPVFRYLTYSTIAYKTGNDWDNEPTHVGEDHNKIEFFDNFEIGLNIEAGVQFKRYQFTLYYNPGFTNIYNKDFTTEAEWKNYSFGLNIAILFGSMD